MTTPPSEKAFSFEGIKVAMRQTKDGYALTFVIHPNDVPPELFASAVGQRYMVALVEVDEHEQPVERTTEGKEAVKYAALLCDEPLFYEFLWKVFEIEADDPDFAAAGLRKILGIDSRSEIGTSFSVREKFKKLVAEYKRWAGI